MPTQRLSMRRIREVLRLRHQGLTERVIARMIGVSNGVVHGYQRRARLAGLTWPLPDGLDDDGLELLLFPAPTAASQSDRRPEPDWIYVEKELRRRSVTHACCCGKNIAQPIPTYTWFCTTFDAWKKRARPTMRQTHMGCISRNSI
jgi:transposase